MAAVSRLSIATSFTLQTGSSIVASVAFVSFRSRSTGVPREPGGSNLSLFTRWSNGSSLSSGTFASLGTLGAFSPGGTRGSRSSPISLLPHVSFQALHPSFALLAGLSRLTPFALVTLDTSGSGKANWASVTLWSLVTLGSNLSGQTRITGSPVRSRQTGQARLASWSRLARWS